MGKAAEYMSRTKIGARFHETRESRKLVLVIVAIALLLDNMLLTTVGKRFYSKILKRYNWSSEADHNYTSILTIVLCIRFIRIKVF